MEPNPAELAREHDALITHLIKAMAADRQRGLGYEIAMENPFGTLRKRIDVLSNEWWKRSVARKTVDYCAYKHPWQKRTDVFTSMIDWQPEGTTGTGLCEQRCGQGACVHGSKPLRYKHFQNMDRIEGGNVKQRKNAVPHMLLGEVLDQARSKHPNRKVVLDLCCGYQSLRPVVEERGMVYVGVDIRDVARPIAST